MVKGLRIGRVLGIDISIDPSWLIIAFLFSWSFYIQFGLRFEELDGAVLVAMAIATAVVFFGSVLLHELSHSVMAMRLGIPVEGITLFLFGGVSKMKLEASRPRDEFLIAIVGPLSSIVLAGFFWLVVTLTSGLFSPIVLFALGYLGWLNLLLGVFNMLPGFPLDGGRVLRSVLWRSKGSLVDATRGAARSGRVIASLLIGLGLVSVLWGNLGGLWMAAIGWFLLQAAGAADQDVVVRSFLEEVTAADLMSPELVNIPFDTTVEDAVDDYFLRYDHSAFPVVSEDRTGLLTLRAVRQIPKDQWGVRQVWTAMTELGDTCTVGPATPMNQVMEKIREMEQDRVLVIDDGRIVGIITPRDVARWVQRSQELGLSPSDGPAA